MRAMGAYLTHSIPCRNAAAAAKMPTTRLTSVSAHRIVNGVPNGSGPTIAALEAATPKISTGTVSGSTSTGEQQSAAPQRHRQRRADQADEGQRRRAGEQRQRDGAAGLAVEVQEQAEQRRRDHQRQAGGEPVRGGLGGDREFQRRVAHQDQVERAVLVIGGEQPIERQQRREQRAKPQDRRPDAAEQREVGPDRERHQRDHDQEEQHADAAAAADPDREAHVADEQRQQAGSCGVSEPQLLGRFEPDRPMRRRDDQPAAGEVLRASSPASVSCASRSSAEVGSSSSQIGRCTATSRAMRQPPPLAGRQVGGRQVGQRRQPDGGERGSRRLRAAEIAGPECEVFGDRQRGLQRVLVAEVVGLLRDGPFGVAAGQRQLPAGEPDRPATIRSSEDLPAPLRPVTSRASPPDTAKPSPENTSRPPRTQARPLPSSRIAARPAGIGTPSICLQRSPPASSYSRLSSRARKKPL